MYRSVNVRSEISIEATGLTKVYGPLTAIDEVSFEVEKGEVLGFWVPMVLAKAQQCEFFADWSEPLQVGQCGWYFGGGKS